VVLSGATVECVPRPLRIQEPGVLYHAGSRAVDRRRIFGAVPGDVEFFLHLLAVVVERYGWKVYAYCLMPNHFHLVFETPRGNIAAGMRVLKGA
jgi:putative transposase